MDPTTASGVLFGIGIVPLLIGVGGLVEDGPGLAHGIFTTIGLLCCAPLMIRLFMAVTIG
jgi:hypothetical protein